MKNIPSIDNNISVIIPVFNAVRYVSKAVESILIQPEVAEILLIEDGSTDHSLEVCRKLAEEHEKVQLFTHQGNENKGAGMSRNLGIQKARFDYIAFLDADDFFLPDRFKAEREIFPENAAIDGIYGALGFHYYSPAAESKFRETGLRDLTTLPGKVPAHELFLSILWLHNTINGHFSVDTLTVKREVFFGKTELFNDLKLHEDTVFILQLSLNCILQAGIIDKAIGMRGVHENNRISDNPENSDSRFLMWSYLCDWSKRTSKSKPIRKLFEAFMIAEKIRLQKRIPAFFLFLYCNLTNHFFFSRTLFFNSSCIKVFGKRTGSYIIKMKHRITMRMSKSRSIPNLINAV